MEQIHQTGAAHIFGAVCGTRLRELITGEVDNAKFAVRWHSWMADESFAARAAQVENWGDGSSAVEK